MESLIEQLDKLKSSSWNYILGWNNRGYFADLYYKKVVGQKWGSRENYFDRKDRVKRGKPVYISDSGTSLHQAVQNLLDKLKSKDIV